MSLLQFIKSPVGQDVIKLKKTYTSLKENAAKLAAAKTKVTEENESITRLNLEIDALNIKATALRNTNDFLTDLDAIFTVDEDEIEKNTAALTANDREKAPIGFSITDREAEIATANAEIATLNTNRNTALGELETAVKNLATHMTAIKTAAHKLNTMLHPSDNTARIAELDTVIAGANAKLDAVDTGLKAQLVKAENDKVEADNALNNFVAVDLAAYKASIKAEGNSKVSAITKKIEAADDVFDEETSGAATAEKKECMKLYAAKMKEADNKYAEEKAALENASAAFDAPIAALEKEITDTELSVTKAEAEKTALSVAGGDLASAIGDFKVQLSKYNSYDIEAVVTPKFVALLDGTAAPVVPTVSEAIQKAFDVAEKAVEKTQKVIEKNEKNLESIVAKRDAKVTELTKAQEDYDVYLLSADGVSHQKDVDDADAEAKAKGKVTKKLTDAKKIISDKKEPVDKAQEELKNLEKQLAAFEASLEKANNSLPGLQNNLASAKTALEEEGKKVAAEKVVFDALPKVDVDALLAKDKADAVKIMENFVEKLFSLNATEEFATKDFSTLDLKAIDDAAPALAGEAEFVFGFHA